MVMPMTRNELLEAYAARRWSVFPLRGKVPLPGTRGHLDARIGYPIPDGANIGIDCAASGLVVVDIDPRNGGYESWGRIVAENGKPSTPLASWTGGGGIHLIFRASGSRYRKSIGNGLDLKHRGYIVLPPSVHPSGAAYRWAAFGEAPPMPPWLDGMARIAAPAFAPDAPRLVREQWGGDHTTPYGRAILDRQCARITGASPGAYNDTICSVVFSVWQWVAGNEISHDDALMAVMLACERTGNNNHKTANVIERASRAGMAHPRGK